MNDEAIELAEGIKKQINAVLPNFHYTDALADKLLSLLRSQPSEEKPTCAKCRGSGELTPFDINKPAIPCPACKDDVGEFVREIWQLWNKTSESPWVKNYDMCNAVWIEYGPKALRLAYPLDDSRIQYSRGADVDFIVWAHENIPKIAAHIAQLQKRIQAMYAGDLSPESRLNGYKVITNELTKQRDELKEQIAELKKEAE